LIKCIGTWTVPFDHYLDIVFPGDLGQLAQDFQFNELRFVTGVIDRTWTQAIAKAEADIIRIS